MRKIYRSLFAFIILSLCSCEQDLIFNYDTQHITATDFDLCSSQACASIDVSFTRFSAPESLSSNIDQWFLKTLTATVNQEENKLHNVQEVLLTFINDAQVGYPETTVLSDAHELSVEFVISYTSNEVVSMTYYSDLFDGGAHGFYQELYVNFNPKTGEQFSNEKLVTEAFYAFAQAEFTQAFPTQNFDIDKTVLAENGRLQMGFSKDGMLLNYKDQDVLPLADANYELLIPWEEIETYITF